jgi:hypothetical protein
LPFYWQTQGAVAGALRQTDCHFMGDKGKVFDLIVQRSVVTGQVELDLDLDLDFDLVILKAIINNTRLIACCIYSKFFDVGVFR